jgi:hypothetical protein
MLKAVGATIFPDGQALGEKRLLLKAADATSTSTKWTGERGTEWRRLLIRLNPPWGNEYNLFELIRILFKFFSLYPFSINY